MVGYLFTSLASWGCTCAGLPPFCKLLAAPGAKLELRAGAALFAGKAVYSQPTSEKEAWDIEKRHLEQYPQLNATPGSYFPSLGWEDRKRLWLDWWGANASPATRERLLRLSAPSHLFLGAFALTRIKVTEVFAGSIKPGDEVELLGGLGGADCSFHFRAGSEYLIEGNTAEGFWTTSGCSRSRTIGGHDPELAALRAWRDGKPVQNTLAGYFYDVTNRGDRAEAASLSGVVLRLTGPNGAMDVVTDSRGEFALANPPPGSYRFTSSTPGWTLSSAPFTVGAGCAMVMAGLTQMQSVVTGRVVPQPGEELVPVPVALLPVTGAAPKRIYPSAKPDRSGNFRLAQVEPGDYHLVINPRDQPKATLRYRASSYPGVSKREQAEVIHVERGVDIALPAPWRLPSLIAEKRIEGILLTVEGKPAAETRFIVNDREGDYPAESGGPTDPDGLIQFTVLAGRSYRLEAQMHDPAKSMYYRGVAEIGPEFAGKLMVQLVEEGPKPKSLMIWPRSYSLPRRPAP